MLDQRRRCWAFIKTTLAQGFVLLWISFDSEKLNRQFVLVHYISAFKHDNVNKTWHQISKISESLTSVLPNLNNFHSYLKVEVADRISGTQLQLGENVNYFSWH